jgi:hypothetical protein
MGDTTGLVPFHDDSWFLFDNAKQAHDFVEANLHKPHPYFPTLVCRGGAVENWAKYSDRVVLRLSYTEKLPEPAPPPKDA